MGVCNCSMFLCTLLYVHSSFAITLIGKRELVALLSLSSWCLVIVVWLYLAMPWVCLQFVIVVFPDHTHLLFLVPFVILNGFYRVYAYAFLLHTRAYQLLPQLWIEQFDTLPSQCRHIEHKHERV